MKVALISRSTLFTVKGGDTFQIVNTARHMTGLGIKADIKLTYQPINYNEYDLLHFFNITRPADILYHIGKSIKPFVVSPILVNYQEYDRQYRSGLAGILFRMLSQNHIEYMKTIARWVRGNDKLMSVSYLWKGQTGSIRKILERAAMVLPNSYMEYEQLSSMGLGSPPYAVIPNGVDAALFTYNSNIPKEPDLVLCAARIEGRKNQLNLIRALNNTKYRLMIIGEPAPNQLGYYHACKKMAASNVSFINMVPQEVLVQWYQKAAVHILPSWFETCGLSTLEAAAMGCHIVVSSRGFVREYYENDAVYCDPGSPESILEAVETAHADHINGAMRQKITERFNWQQAALQTAKAYKQVLNL